VTAETAADRVRQKLARLREVERSRDRELADRCGEIVERTTAPSSREERR